MADGFLTAMTFTVTQEEVGDFDKDMDFSSQTSGGGHWLIADG
jgi:hypothetical protein